MQKLEIGKTRRNIPKWDVTSIKIRYLIRSVTKKSDDYDEKYIKMKFDTDDKLSLNKTIKIPIIIIVIRAVFHENNINYPQVFLDECLYEI